MLFQGKLIQVMSLLLLLTFPIFAELTFCQVPPPVNTTGEEELTQRVDSLKSEIDSLRSELHKIDELKDEFSNLKIKVANKYIDFTTLIIGFLALFAGGSGVVTWLNYRGAKKASLEIQKILHESEQRKKDFGKFIETAKKEIEDKKDDASKMVERFTKEFMDSKKEFDLEITKLKSAIQSLFKSFLQRVDLNTEIMFQLIKEYTDVLPITVDKEKLGKIFDRIYESKMSMYDLQGFIFDLISEERDERMRAIWGIEGMATKENVKDLIKDLQKIADNKDEDSDIRVEAQRAVDNMKRRLGV